MPLHFENLPFYCFISSILFTETASIRSDQDHDGNDIKQWTSVVSDMNDCQATDQLTAEQTTDTSTHTEPQ